MVRDAASETLGMLMKLIGEPSMNKLMPDVDAIKMAKVKEFCDKAEITGKRPKLQPEGGNAPAAKAGAKVVKPGGPQKKPIGKYQNCKKLDHFIYSGGLNFEGILNLGGPK